MKNIISILALSVILTACGNMSAPTTNRYGQGSVAPDGSTQLDPTNYVMRSYSWNTSGGGDLQYSISPNGANFVVNVSRYIFQPKSISFPLTTADSVAAYTLMQNLFMGYDGFVPGQNGGYSGSFSSVTVTDINQTVLPAVVSPYLYSGNSAALSNLHQWIISKIH